MASPVGPVNIPERRLREFLALLSAPVCGDDWGDGLFAPNLVALQKRVLGRAVELAPALAGAELRDVTATDVRVDATLAAVNGSTWKATCIVQGEDPHRIEALRFDQKPEPSHRDTAPLVVIAGTSSTGKSTISAALQQELEGPWIHLDRDALLLRLPAAFQAFPETWGPIVPGLYAAARALIDTGNLVILDTLMVTSEDMRLCRDALAGVNAFVVVLTCDAETAAARERARGTRPAGVAEAQIRQREVITGDMHLDTSTLSPTDAARAIRAALEARPQGRPPAP